MALATVAAALLLSAAWLGQIAPLLAQEGVGIAFDDLSSYPTETGVDRFYVQLTNLDADVAYQVIVSSDNAAAVGVGACRTSSQTRSVTGVEAQDLRFFVHACAVAPVTLTAEVRAAGADTAAATVSQALTVLAFPEGAPVGVRGVPATRGPTGRSIGGRTHEGRPGIVPSISFDNIRIDSVRANWGLPNDNGHALTGYGVLFWKKGTEQPDWGDADTIGVKLSHTFTGLEYDTTYKFRIHACHEDENKVPLCGHWTDPPREVSTAGRPDRPHTIKFPTVTANSVRVTWRIAAETGGVPLTGFQIKYWPYDSENRDSESGAKTHPVDDGSDTGETLTGLAAGTEYELKMRSCNGTNDSHCSSWSNDHRFTTLAGTTPTPMPTATPTPEASRPRNLDITPLRQRKVRLTWTWTGPQVNAFVISARGFGVNDRSDLSSWRTVHSGTSTPALAVADKNPTYKYEFYLHVFYRAKVEPKRRGLQDHAAYEVQVQAVTGKDAANNDVLSEPSDAIILIDTPITSANGTSSGTSGQATLSWKLMQDVLGDSYAGGTARFRYRRTEGTHAAISWLPEEANFKHVGDIPETAMTNGNTLQSLELNDVYAIQFWYEPPAPEANQPAKLRVFAGRDVYVWPSTRAGAEGVDNQGRSNAGERVASYPLNYPLQNTRRIPRATYVYRICSDTFPTRNSEAASWANFIFDAFDRWRVATDGLVVAAYERGPCATYAAVVSNLVGAVSRSLDSNSAAQYDLNTRRAHVQALVGQTRHVGALRDAVLRAAAGTSDGADVGNEVFMFETNARPMVYEFGQEIQPGLCGSDGVACARLRVHHETKGWITDIALKRDKYFEPASGNYVPEIPTVRLELCRTRHPDNIEDGRALSSYNFSLVYSTLVHEIGHAFGIGGGTDGKGPDGQDQQQHHPNKNLDDDSVMDHSLITSRACAPTPLDVLAMYALYQTKS